MNLSRAGLRFNNYAALPGSIRWIESAGWSQILHRQRRQFRAIVGFATMSAAYLPNWLVLAALIAYAVRIISISIRV